MLSFFGPNVRKVGAPPTFLTFRPHYIQPIKILCGLDCDWLNVWKTRAWVLWKSLNGLGHSFPRGWVKLKIKTNIMGRSMLPDVYFLISLAISKKLVVSLQPLTCYSFELWPNSWKILVDSTIHFLKSNDGRKHQACKNRWCQFKLLIRNSLSLTK